MPHRDAKLRLTDMLDAVLRIRSHVRGLDSQSFSQDRKTIDAVLFNLGLLGEAANSIPERVRELAPGLPWSSIRGMRNVIVHEYFGVDLDVVWSTIDRDLGTLEVELQRILAHPDLN